MNLKHLRSMLCLLAMGILFTDGAIAQQGDSLAAMDARAKFASDYAGCLKYSKENSNPSLATVRLGGLETALIEVNTNTKGYVTKCSIVKGGGSERIDAGACDWAKGHWRSLGRCQDHGPRL